jgi:hypothetical protein
MKLYKFIFSGIILLVFFAVILLLILKADYTSGVPQKKDITPALLTFPQG